MWIFIGLEILLNASQLGTSATDSGNQLIRSFIVKSWTFWWHCYFEQFTLCCDQRNALMREIPEKMPPESYMIFYETTKQKYSFWDVGTLFELLLIHDKSLFMWCEIKSRMNTNQLWTTEVGKGASVSHERSIRLTKYHLGLTHRYYASNQVIITQESSLSYALQVS